jgi:hypothetical protein
MKNIFILSLLVSFALICSCQKQDSTLEQQLAQRKVELDTREDALIEREKVAAKREKELDKREKALAENEKSGGSVRTISPDAQSQDVIHDAAEATAERDRRIQEFRADIQARISALKMKAESDRAKRGALEELQSQREPRQPKLKMPGGAVFPAPEATSPTPSPAVGATVSTPSPTPQ